MVLNDDNKGKDILAKATNINRSTSVIKQIIDTDRVKYGEFDFLDYEISRKII